MNACIYARTSNVEKGNNTTSIPNQIEHCKALAMRHGLTVRDTDIFTDIEMLGSLPPSGLTNEDQESRPALGAMVEAIHQGRISRVVVRRVEKLGTSSDVLLELLTLFTDSNIRVVLEPEQPDAENDPRGAFAASILLPCLQYDTAIEEERRAKNKAKKLDEIERLKGRIARLESEIAEN